jgi:hypothetical protein
VIPVSIVYIEIGIVGKVIWQDQYRQKQKSDRHLQRSMQSMRHRVPLSSGDLVPLLLLFASATPNPPSHSKKDFFVPQLASGNLFPHHPKVVPKNAKRPPGNRVASSLGRIVPTEAKPSELSGEILSLAKYRVKAKTGPL